jgi:iron complex outermembrane receptor protein
MKSEKTGIFRRLSLPIIIASALGSSVPLTARADVTPEVPAGSGNASAAGAPAPQDSATATSGSAIPNAEKLPAIVVQATPLPGTAIDADKVPANVQTLTAADLTRNGSASMTQAMGMQLGSINVDDNLNDPFQPDILYRGFEASPVLGTPQGLAVYQNGVRINEAFGDVVNWDLFPDIAIDRVDLVSSNPVYGLNALGGAISVGMKNGFTYAGFDAELAGGSWGQRSLATQYGVNNGTVGFYAAARGYDSDGWRDFSSDAVRQFYTDLSIHGDRGTLDLSFTHANNHLDGQGAAPVQELAVDRSLVFTGPQANLNQLNFLALNGTFNLNNNWSLQGVLYYRQYKQDVANGNTTDYTACTNQAGILCQSDGLTPVTNAAGQNLPDISEDGTLPIGENDYESIRAYSRGAALQITGDDSIFGHGNHFSAGASIDYSKVDFFSGTQIGVINSQLLVEPSDLIVDTPESSPWGATPVSLGAWNQQVGFYVTDTFDVTSDLSVTASARYNIAHIDLRDNRGTDLDGDNSFSHFNPALGATYKLTPTATIYAGVSTNTRTPTASEIECSDPLQPCLLPSNLAGDPPNLHQVVAHTFEFGIRGNESGLFGADGQLAWNFGAFRTNADDDIYGIATSVSSGFYQNIGGTRREGIEAGLKFHEDRFSFYASYAYVLATFQSAMTLPSPSNPHQDDDGNIQVVRGDRMPGIPKNRLKFGVDFDVLPQWKIGGSVILVGNEYYFGDESNQNSPLPGYAVFDLDTTWRIDKSFEFFATVSNLFNTKYANYGIYSDPSGIGTPGVPADGVSNGPGVDNRFISPAAPRAVYAGMRIKF